MVRVSAWPGPGDGVGPSRSSKVSASGQAPSGRSDKVQYLFIRAPCSISPRLGRAYPDCEPRRRQPRIRAVAELDCPVRTRLIESVAAVRTVSLSCDAARTGFGAKYETQASYGTRRRGQPGFDRPGASRPRGC